MKRLVIAAALVALFAADSQAGPIRKMAAAVQENRAERKEARAEARAEHRGVGVVMAPRLAAGRCGCGSASCPSACPCPSCPAAAGRLLPAAGPAAPCQQCPNGVCPLPAIPAPKFLPVPGIKAE